MFKPDKDKSIQTSKLIETSFNKIVQDANDYTLLYGYYVKSGFFSKSVYHYIIGYNLLQKIMIILPVNERAVGMQSPLLLAISEIDSAKYALQGDLKIKSHKLDKILRIVIPPYTAKALGSLGILPILQEESAMEFKQFIKDNF